METKIKKTMCILRCEYFALWILCLGVVLLYECDVFPQGALADDGKTAYLLQVLGILLAVGLIPLSLRLFSLSLVRNVNVLPLEDALRSYRRWNEIRLAMLLAPALVNLSVYYATLETTGLLCAGMVAVALLFCVPGRQRMASELNLPVADSDTSPR